MGFPVAYSEMPRLLLHLLFLLGHLRRLSSWLLRLTGCAADIDSPYSGYSPSPAAAAAHHHHAHGGQLMVLEEHSPATRFGALSASGAPLPDGCSVCLGDFDAAAEVRRPRGCRHVFHRACLDRWAAHGHRTCPLCRTPLLPSPPPVLLPLPLPAS